MILEQEIQDAFITKVKEITSDPNKVKKIAKIMFLARTSWGLSNKIIHDTLEKTLKEVFFNDIKGKYETL